MRKIIAICGAIVCSCILATQLFLYSPTELKAEQAEKRDETAGIEERVVQQEIGHLKQEIARLEGQIRQLYGQTRDQRPSSDDKSNWLEGALEPSGTATEADVSIGETFHSLGDWTLKTGTMTTLPSFPENIIVMWSGLIDSIPTGWVLCNGDTIIRGLDTLILPDLRDRFVRGALSGVQPGATGGAPQHRHWVKSHHHLIDPPLTPTGAATASVFRQVFRQAGSRRLSGGATHHHMVDVPGFWSGPPTDTVWTDYASNLPPYYRLAFIMRL